MRNIKLPKDAEQITTVFKSHDYLSFSMAKENRIIDENHVKQIIKSINKKGLMMNPIIVDAELNILDGQHRFEACRELDLPIYFVIDEKADTKVCATMNSYSRNWQCADFIHYGAKTGNATYQFVQNCYDEFYELPKSVIDEACNIYSASGHGNTHSKVREMEFVIKDNEKNSIVSLLNMMNEMNKHRNLTSKEARIVAKIYRYGKISPLKMIRNYAKYGDTIKGFTCEPDIIGEYERIYNYGVSRANYVYISHECDVAGASRKSPRTRKQKER